MLRISGYALRSLGCWGFGFYGVGESYPKGPSAQTVGCLRLTKCILNGSGYLNPYSMTSWNSKGYHLKRSKTPKGAASGKINETWLQ